MSASKHRLYFLLQRTAHGLKTRADAALSEAGGMTTAQSAVMSIVAKEGPVSQAYLASTLKQRESAMTSMVDRLMKAGYLDRERSPSDGRAWLLKATPYGRDALRAIRGPFQSINAILDESFEEADMNALAAGLTQVLDRLDRDKAES